MIWIGNSKPGETLGDYMQRQVTEEQFHDPCGEGCRVYHEEVEHTRQELAELMGILLPKACRTVN